MVQINFAQKSVTVKIVYYGPGMSGKTTNLEIVHQRAPEPNKGDLTSISTDGDRTLFFDFMPLDLGTVAGMRTQFQIYTVPGQVYYNSTRKLVLQGVDGVIFIADSSASMLQENLESLANLQENLREYGKDIDEIPMVIQYNKRDLPDAMSVEKLEQHLNQRGAPSFEAIASSGQGVFPTLKALAARVLDSIHEQTGASTGARPAAAAPSQAPAMTPPTSTPAPSASSEVPGPPASMPAPPAPMPAPVAMPSPPAPIPSPVSMPAPPASIPSPVSMPAPPASIPAPAAAPIPEPAAPRHVAASSPQPEPPAPAAQHAAVAPAAGPAPIPMGGSHVAPAAGAPAPAPPASTMPADASLSAPSAPSAPSVAPLPAQLEGHEATGGLRMAQPEPQRFPAAEAPAPVPTAPAAPAPVPMNLAPPTPASPPAAPASIAPAPVAQRPTARPFKGGGAQAAPAPGGRLRQRTAPAPSGRGGGDVRSRIITTIIVLGATAVGVAIGGTIFNLI